MDERDRLETWAGGKRETGTEVATKVKHVQEEGREGGGTRQR